MDISPVGSPAAGTPSRRLAGWGLKVASCGAASAIAREALHGTPFTRSTQVDKDGLKLVGGAGETSAPVKEAKTGSSVLDSDGTLWELEGSVREDLSQGTPKKLLSQFASGFPKTWARAASQARKRAQLVHDLKDVNWLDLPFVGIEYKSIASIRTEPFSFPHLVRELREGVLADKEYPIYLFQCAQPCWNDTTRSMMQVPYIVAIDCPVPPPNKLAYHSVQLAAHEIIDMKALPAHARYEWTPYIPKHITELDKLPIQCHVLGWAGRTSQFGNLDEAAVHYIEYLHPYILLPQVVEKLEAPVVTSVDFEWKHGDKAYQIVFDKEIDRLATFIPEFLEDNGLVGAVPDETVKEALQAAFKDKRAKVEAQHKAVLDGVAAFSDEQRQQLRDIKTYKFYPHHPNLDVAPFADDSINQYFGRATRVMLPTAEDVALMREMEEQDAVEAEAPSATKRARQQQQQQQADGAAHKRGREDADEEAAADAAEPADSTKAKAAKLDDAGDQ